MRRSGSEMIVENKKYSLKLVHITTEKSIKNGSSRFYAGLTRRFSLI